MVMAIIGIILSLVLVAGMDAANRANERATQIADHQARSRA